MAEFKFDNLLDAAYKMVASSMIEGEKEKSQFEALCAVCTKHKLPVMKFMLAMNDLNKLLSEDDDAYD